MRKIIILICVLGMMCCLTNSIYAAEVEPISPQWENAQNVTCSLVFDSSKGNITVYVYGNPGTTSISGTLTLYRGSTEVDSWDISGRRIVNVSDTFTGVSGSTYRLVLDIDVTTNGVVESIEEEDSAKCP